MIFSNMSVINADGKALTSPCTGRLIYQTNECYMCSKRYSFLILVITERWVQSWSLCTGSQPAGD